MTDRSEWGISAILLLVLAGFGLVVLRGGPGSEKPSPASAQEPATDEPAQEAPILDLPPLPDLLSSPWQKSLSERYDPSNLHVKIDGRAGLYLEYGFRCLDYTEYLIEEPPQRIEIYAYTLASLLDAFGLYSTEKPDEGATVTVGREGYVWGSSLNFWKGDSYVQILSEGVDTDSLEKLATQAASVLQDSGEEILSTQIFPQEGLSSQSIAYAKKAPFGIDPLPRGFTASYSVGDTSFSGYLSAAPVEGQKSIEDLATFFSKLGKTQRMTLSGQPCVQGEFADMVFLFACSNNRLMGAAEISGPPDPAREFLRGFLAMNGGAP